MSAVEYVVRCGEVTEDAPALCHAVMGDYSANLTVEGVRLQRALEAACERPLLRRTMTTLNTGIGIDRGTGVYREDPSGKALYDFAMMDQVIDVIVGPRSVPFFGVGFMPEDLSRAVADAAEEEGTADLPPEALKDAARKKLPEPWMKMDRFPPKDYDKWHDLVGSAVAHMVERHGAEEVSRWYWDFWNEPDLRFYWLGTHEEFFKTYDYAAHAIKEALPAARVGGIGTAGGGTPPIFMEFLEHCTSGTNHCTGEKGSPLDFITFHMKGGPTGRKGIFLDPWEAEFYEVRTPSLDHIVSSTRETLAKIASVRGTGGRPVFLTESDIDWGTGTSIFHNPNMHYRNSEYFAAFECALFRRMLDLRAEFPRNPIEGLFLDTFLIPGRRIFEGQRTLVTGGCIDKPILNGLRLLGKLGEKRLAVEEPEGAPVQVVATSAADGSVRVMAVNYSPPFDYSDSHEISLKLKGLSGGLWRALHWRVDSDHSNAYTVWLEMGRPVVPSEDELERIKARMGLEEMEPPFEIDPAAAALETVLPPQSVSLWTMEKV